MKTVTKNHLIPALKPWLSYLRPNWLLVAVAAAGHAEKDLEVEDTAVICLRYRSGGMGQILASTAAFRGGPRRIHVTGRGGTAELVGWVTA